MDGTASLSYYLTALETEGRKQKQITGKKEKDKHGAIIKLNKSTKTIYLTFTADSLFEGGALVLDVLKKWKIKASFFLTGIFFRQVNQGIFIEIIPYIILILPCCGENASFFVETERL